MRSLTLPLKWRCHYYKCFWEIFNFSCLIKTLKVQYYCYCHKMTVCKNEYKYNKRPVILSIWTLRLSHSRKSTSYMKRSSMENGVSLAYRDKLSFPMFFVCRNIRKWEDKGLNSWCLVMVQSTCTITMF